MPRSALVGPVVGSGAPLPATITPPAVTPEGTTPVRVMRTTLRPSSVPVSQPHWSLPQSRSPTTPIWSSWLYSPAIISWPRPPPYSVPQAMLRLRSRMSPRSEMPYCSVASKPLSFFLRMKLVTPATASEPQAADAPPVTTSTRSTRLVGIEFRSTRPVAVLGTTRRPSISTRVRVAVCVGAPGFRLRRFA